MAIKLELYKVFKEVADSGNITVAAQNLFISQSAVSQSIKILEQELQTRLFSRNSRGVTLTNEGHILYDYVRSALGLIENGEEKLLRTKNLQMGQLTIGVSDTVASKFLLPFLDKFHKQYPAIHIQVISGRSQKVLGLLQSGKVDIAFASSPQEENICHQKCFTTHQIFACSSDFPIDKKKIYSIEEIADLPLILLEKKASSRTFLEKYFLQHGCHLDPSIELGSRNLLVDLASIGFGVISCQEEFIKDLLDSGSLVKLKTDFTIPPRSVDMCILKSVPLSAAAQRFFQFVTENLSF